MGVLSRSSVSANPRPPRSRLSRQWRAWRLGWTACVGLAVGAPLGAQTPQEYQIKAVFLLNFLQFVEWPESAFATPDAPLRVGVLGHDPFGPILDEAVRGEAVRGRAVEVVRSRSWRELRNCQVVFISRSERRRLAEFLAGWGEAPILTVSDAPGFARAGGIIGFFVDGNRVRFEINRRNAQRRELKLSSQLLGVARIVDEA